MISRFDGNNAYLSNFYKCSIWFTGKEWSSVEHAYQAYKSFEPAIREHIRGLVHARDAKRAGTRVTLRRDWEEVKIPLMTVLVRSKFLQSSTLSKRLLSTENHRLVEGNGWHDNIWGNCDCEKCKEIEGKNLLGEILMEIRSEISALRLFPS